MQVYQMVYYINYHTIDHLSSIKQTYAFESCADS